MHLGTKVVVVSGFLAAGFISYVANNAAFEAKRGLEVFNPHKYLGLYMVDISMGILGAGVNYAITSCCDLYRRPDLGRNSLEHMRHPLRTNSR